MSGYLRGALIGVVVAMVLIVVAAALFEFSGAVAFLGGMLLGSLGVQVGGVLGEEWWGP